MSGAGNRPDMRKAIQAGAEQAVRSLRFADVGVVEAIDNAKRRATVRPLAAMPRVDRHNREVVFESAQPLEDVPIGMFGGSKAALYLPVSVGDYVLLIWLDRGMDELKGGAFRGSDEILPQDLGGFHAYNACFAMPFRLFDADGIAEDVNNVGLGDQPVIYAPTYLRVGDGDSAKFVALAEKVEDNLNALRTVLNTHISAYNTHLHLESGVSTGPPLVTPAGPSAAVGTASSITSTAATRLKTE